MNNMQLILDEVDLNLSQVPALTDTRLRVLESIAKAWDQIDASVRDDEEGSAVPTLMLARQKMAGVFFSLGQLNLVDEEYRKLYDIAKHRITVKQGTDGARYNLAMVCNALGDGRQQVHRDMVRSREYFEEALKLIRDIQQYPKPDPKLGGMKKYSHYRLGCLWDELGNETEARNQFQKCRELREELSRDGKESQKRQSQLLLALARCGEVEAATQLADSLGASAKPDAELLLERARAMAQCSRASKTEDQRKTLVDAALSVKRELG